MNDKSDINYCKTSRLSFIFGISVNGYINNIKYIRYINDIHVGTPPGVKLE